MKEEPRVGKRVLDAPVGELAEEPGEPLSVCLVDVMGHREAAGRGLAALDIAEPCLMHKEPEAKIRIALAPEAARGKEPGGRLRDVESASQGRDPEVPPCPVIVSIGADAVHQALGRKVVSNGDGSAPMEDPARAASR